MVIAFIGFVIFFAYAAGAFFRRTRIPDVLLLTLLGIIVGPILHIASAADFGKVGGVMGTIALVVLLFQGGTTLNIATLAGAFRTTLALSLTAFIFAVAIIAAVGIYLLGLPPLSAAIFGTICAGTSSAVVIPIVQGLKMSEFSETVLVLESAFTDVLCIVAVFALVESAQAAAGSGIAGSMVSVISTLIVSPVVGLGFALLWLALTARDRRENTKPLAALALAFVAYGATDHFGFSGGLAALTFGFGLANFKVLRFDRVIKGLRDDGFEAVNEGEKFYYSEAVFILKTFFFVYLGLSMYLPKAAEGYVTLAVVLVYLSRILVVRLTAVPAMTLREASIASVMAPKGLAAAVLASVPLQAGIIGGEIIRDKTFLMVLVSIVLTAVAVPLIERGLLDRLLRPALGFSSRAD